MTDLYQTMKERAFGLRQTLYMRDDPYRELMADRDNPNHAFFLMHLPTLLPEEKDRQILLDGLAREYAGLERSEPALS